MVLACHVILQDHLIKRSCDWEPFMLSHHPAKFGGHGQNGSGDMSFVAEEQNSKCSLLNLPLLLISKAHGISN